MRIKNLRGVSKVRFTKTRLLHLGNVEKPPHSQFLPIRTKIAFHENVEQKIKSVVETFFDQKCNAEYEIFCIN